MCGICGYINIDGRPVGNGAVLRGMMDAIKHRGPDDEGVYISGPVAFGHRRLSIIDLKKGHQPMLDETGRLAIIYNGEIYNFLELKTELINRGHVFSTHSDTEVALKAYMEWGPECLDRFNGMFALAIWDGRDNSLFLARDRFGKKPLYHAIFGNTFIYGSELKSLYRHPDVKMEIDRRALGKYFAYDYIPAPMTGIKGISKLEAGHYLLIKDGAVKKNRYWDFRFKIDGRRRSDTSGTKDAFLELLRESVRKRLISDVPLGVFLSGGIDSSAVVAMMARLMDPKDIKTFSIGFKEKTYNEADSARLIAGYFKTDHREKIIDAGAMLDVLPTVIGTIDEPFADSSIIPTYMVSQFTQGFVKVALGGDGGDELFMGYPSFIGHRLASIYDKIPLPGKNRLVEAILHLLPGKADYMSLHFKATRFLRGMGLPTSLRHQVWIGSFPPSEQKGLFKDLSDEALFDPYAVYNESAAYFDTYRDLCDMDRVEYLYIKTYLTDDILTKVDRASMATSLEVRAPFLDKEMAEFAATIPNDMKLHGFTSKYIMKEALKGILPESILKKPKHGFAVPVGDWFKTGLKPLLLRTFERKAVEREGMLNYSYIENLLNDHFAGRADNGRRIWSIFIYQLWYNKWIRKEAIGPL